MSFELKCPKCGKVTVILIEAKIDNEGVACYCRRCDGERNARIRMLDYDGSEGIKIVPGFLKDDS